MQQQHLDQFPGAGGVAVRGASGGPERLVLGGERPALAGLDQRGRSGRRTRFPQQDFEVVVQHQGGFALGGAAFVAGHLGPAASSGSGDGSRSQSLPGYRCER